MPSGVYFRTKEMKLKNGRHFGICKGRNMRNKNGNYRILGFVCSRIDGYQFIKIKENKWVSYHRYLVEKFIGYKLKKGWVIHHLDGNKTNNKLRNLYIFTKRALHTNFEVFIKYNIINRNILKSNLKEYKNAS